MAEKTKEDEKPPVETESKETPENPPAPETPSTEVKEVAKEHDEKVPAWGAKLTESVDSLTASLSALLEAPTGGLGDPVGKPDDSPAPEPWHKRGFKR